MRKLALILVLTACLPTIAPAQAAPADQPKTGQTTCTDTTGGAIPCTASGQDGDHQAGVAWPAPRYVVGTGATAACVTDKLTGLMWMGTPDSVADTWANALASANNLTLCGFSDWRLPNINELESLVNSAVGDQATYLNTQGFNGVKASYYWSSSSHPASPGAARIVVMTEGSVSAYDKASNSYVWPVRTAQ